MLEAIVAGTGESLLGHGQRVVPGRSQAHGDFVRQVFVDLEEHHDAPGKSGTMSSRASSAA